MTTRWTHEIDGFTVDVELTNRCNTHCEFCPRDRTPHQGLMKTETFEQVLGRLVEFRAEALRLFDTRVSMSFCGLGEQLLHHDGPDFVERARSVGFVPSMCSNGSHLDRSHARALVDAGLGKIYVNCGEIGEEYERVYQLPFDRLVENVKGFLEVAGDHCEVHIVLVDHRGDQARMDEVTAFWRGQGVKCFFPSPMLNRSGSLEVDGMAFTSMPEVDRARAHFESLGIQPVCPAAFAYPFIGYDGNYYLCSSDWEKRVSTGSVFEDSLMAGYGRRMAAVTSREPICRSCNHDPLNKLALLMAGTGAVGKIDEAARTSVAHTETMRAMLQQMEAAGHLSAPAPTPVISGGRTGAHRLIPVSGT